MPSANFFQLLFSAILSMLVSTSASAAASSDWQKLDVLNHRLSLSAPPGTKLVPKDGTSLPKRGEQTLSDHFDIDIAGLKLRLVVTELLFHVDALTEANVRAASPLANKRKASQSVIGPVTGQGTIRVARFVMPKAIRVARGYFFARSFLLGRDGNLLRMDMFADSEAIARSHVAQRTAAAIYESVRAGPRLLNSGTDVKLIGGELTIDLLDGYTTVVEFTENKSVMNIVRIGKAGEPVSGAIMYVGHNVRPSPPLDPIEPLDMFGRKGIWTHEMGNEGMIERSVWLLSSTDPEDEPQVKFHIIAADALKEQELLRMIKSIRSRSLH